MKGTINFNEHTFYNKVCCFVLTEITCAHFAHFVWV